MEIKSSPTVIFSNYNPSFNYFNQKYVEVCLEISKTLSLRKIRTKVSTFLFEFSYALPTGNEWKIHKEKLKEINNNLTNDTAINSLMEKDDVSFKEQVKAFPLYYRYFVDYLNLLGDFISDLSSTYLPRNKLQQERLKFYNDSPFYEKLHEYKNEVFKVLSNFNITDFRIAFNTFLTFFYAYKIFINEKYSLDIEKICGDVLGSIVNVKAVDVLYKYPDFNEEDRRFLYLQENRVHYAILYCVSLINSSFSHYGVLPKQIERIYGDRHLI